jgi:hypothetical protein
LGAFALLLWYAARDDQSSLTIEVDDPLVGKMPVGKERTFLLRVENHSKEPAVIHGFVDVPYCNELSCFGSRQAWPVNVRGLGSATVSLELKLNKAGPFERSFTLYVVDARAVRFLPVVVRAEGVAASEGQASR